MPSDRDAGFASIASTPLAYGLLKVRRMTTTRKDPMTVPLLVILYSTWTVGFIMTMVVVLMR